MNIKKSLILAGLLSVAMTTSYSTFADEMAAPAAEAAAAAAEPAPPYTLTFNLGVYSKYMFRGVDVNGTPAVQGGIDFGHSSGFYAGTWWSNLNPYSYGESDFVAGSEGNHLETDWYVGYAHTFDNGFGVNFLANTYFYPEGHTIAGTSRKIDTAELSAAFTFKWLTYTYFYIPTDYYGAKTSAGGDTDGADYHEIKVNYKLPFGDLNFMAKVGYQSTGDLGAGGTVNGHYDGGQGDYAIGINRDFSLPGAGGKSIDGFNAGLQFTDTFSVKDETYYVDATNGARDTNKAQLWAYIKRTW
ncbi:MAG: TorF family putative porin [Methylophilaceae bacterium]